MVREIGDANESNREPAQARHPRVKARTGARAALLLAILLVGIWALFVARAYFDFSVEQIPAGNEFSSAVQSHHLWTRVKTCGWCALWDGSERGGFPALVDPLGSALHPLVSVTTLALGVVNGAKISLIVCLALAGLAQLWLARELGLGWLPQIWGALLTVVGGHLAARMELGLFSVVLSTTMASFTFPAALRLARTGAARDVVLFAAILALFAVSGQGYIQVGYLATTPALLLLLLAGRGEAWQRMGRFFAAAGLGLLLAAPFIVPFARFLPNFVKDGDPYLAAAQPFPYYLLNLAIDDPAYFLSDAGNKLPYPHMYAMFIGVVPILLAGYALWVSLRQRDHRLWFLAASAGLALIMGSMLPLQVLQPLVPGVALLRFAPIIGGLAVPPILGLAAFALNRVWQQIRNVRRPALLLPLVILLAVPIFRSYRFSQNWLYTVKVPEQVDVLLDYFVTEELRWVQPPFGEHIYIEPAVRRGLKLSPGILTWRWRDRVAPKPAVEANPAGPPPGAFFLEEVADIPVYVHATLPYATVSARWGRVACRATGTGGFVEVSCDAPEPGTLMLRENQASGWRAWRDGERVPLLDGQWLALEAPQGNHTFRFRYLPWDAPLAFALFFFGVGIAIVFWNQRE